MNLMSPASASAYSITQFGAPPQERAPTPPQLGSTRERIHESAKEFESVFLAQMLKPMFNTVKVDENFGGGAAEETWRGILVEKYADEITRAGGIGLAEMIEKQMLKLQEVKDGNQTTAATNKEETVSSQQTTGTAEGGTPATDKTVGAAASKEAGAQLPEALSSRRTGGFSAGYAGASGGGTGNETTYALTV